MKLNNSKNIDGKINITKEYENSEEIKEILKDRGESLEAFQRWREKHPNVDLSIYTINKR